MTLAADIANDLSLMDGYQSMTLTPRGASAISCYGIPHALTGRAVALMGGMGLAPGDRMVSLQANTTSGNVPKPNDKLTIGSTTYSVVSCEIVTLDTRYRLIVRQEA